MYNLGCLAVFLLTGVSATTTLKENFMPEHQWTNWSGTYDDVLPFIREATEVVLEDVVNNIPVEHRERLINCIRYLLEPEIKGVT